MPDDIIQGEMMLSASIAPRAPEWIQIAQTGRWRGKGTPLIVGDAHLESALAYFQRHYAAEGTDLVIDYDHATHKDGIDAPAAGWITSMELREGAHQLWAQAQWNADAAVAIKERKFRHLSPVFRFNAKDRITGERTMLQIPSVALTNTPFLTELQALNDADTPIEEIDMTLMEMLSKAWALAPALVAAKLGIPEDAADEIVAHALRSLIPDADVGAEPEAIAGEPAVEPEVARVKMMDTFPLPMASGREPPPLAQPEIRPAPKLEPIAEAELDAVGQAPEPVAIAASSRVLTLLGLEPDSDETLMCSTIVSLQAQALGAKQEAQHLVETKTAQELVDAACRAGKIQPALKEFYLNALKLDREATELAMSNLVPLVNNNPPTPAPGPRAKPDKAGAFRKEIAGAHGVSEAAWVAGMPDKA